MIGGNPCLNSLTLSRGSSFDCSVTLNRRAYPAGTTATISVKDDSGILLAEFDGFVVGNKANFTSNEFDLLDSIPHGSKFDLFLNMPDGRVEKNSYGIVVRIENRYPLIPKEDSTNYALQFSDNFDRKYVGKYWQVRGGKLSIHDNILDVPNSLGPDIAFLQKAAALWYAPLNTDTVTINSSFIYEGDGACTIVLCSDYSMRSWVGVRFSNGAFNDKCQIVRGTGPMTWESVPGGGIVDNVIRNGDNYSIKFNSQTKHIAVYENEQLAPMLVWDDTSGIIRLGAGFRYAGFMWETALLTPGPQPTGWSAKDGV